MDYLYGTIAFKKVKLIKKIFIQPIVPSYRVPFFNELSKLYGPLEVYADDAKSEFKSDSDKLDFLFVKIEWKNIGGVRYTDINTMRRIIKSGSVIVHVADFKYLSLWALLLFGRFFGSKVWLHGQGGYRKQSTVRRITYAAAILFAEGYICYTEYSSKKLKENLPKFLHSKIFHVSNSLYMGSLRRVDCKVGKDLFYIGRVREHCGIELLLEAALLCDVKVKVVGNIDTEYKNALELKYPNSEFYGKVFCLSKQLDIAETCFAGAYGGDAGLSVVHYMAFGLPVIVHDQIESHMGPEPSYIIDGYNGLKFTRGNLESLKNRIETLLNDHALRERLSKGAVKTYKNLSDPSMAKQFSGILSKK